MRKITKLLTLALAALMIMGAMPVSAAYADVSVDDAALYDAVELLTTLGVAKGTSETEFSPEALVTRQQMAAFVYRLMKAGRSSEGGVNTTPFADLEDSTFFNMISWANTAGIIKGTSATTFNPKGNITLQDAYVMVVRALGYEKDGALAYPFGYVDQAEALDLDEDIPSTVDYTDNLTRGQVAIILANAFYADMNEKTIKYDWIENPNVEGDYQYAAVEVVETIAHKIFGVEEKTFNVVATAHYGFNDVEPTTEENKDIDTLKGIYEGTETVVEYELDDLKLDGSSDDYFLAELTLFVKGEDVVASKSNLIKKTVTAADVEIARSTKTDEKYYVDGEKNNEKVMTGLVTFDGIKAYLDASVAPYSYTSLVPGEEGKAAVQFIELTGGEYTEDFATFEYSDFVNFEGQYGATYTEIEEGEEGEPELIAYDALTDAFEGQFSEVYNGGLYEADVYDVNGDGYAEYVFVKTYQFIQLLDKKNTAGLVVDYAEALKVKDIEATVEGVEFADKDYVLAYVNEDADYLKVVEVIKPFEEKVTSKSKKEGYSEVITFANGTKVDTYGASDKFEDSTYLYEDFAAGTVYTVYAKDGVVLYTDASSAAAEFDTNANYAVVLGDEVKVQTKVVDGEYKEIYFVKTLIDGAVKSVQLAGTAKVFNKYDEEGDVTEEGLAKATSQKIKTEEQANAVVDELNGKFSTFTKTSEGAYVFTAIHFTEANGENEEDLFISTEDENAVFYDVENATIKHFSGSIYKATGFNGIDKFNVKDYSKLIIKSVEEDEAVYTVYDASNLSKFAETPFTEIKAVFINNTKSNVENLGIFFATVGEDGFASTATKEYRIVIETTEVADEDDEMTIYTVIDLVGNKTENVEVATEGDEFEDDAFVVLNKEGEISANATIYDVYKENALFNGAFTSYDAEYNFLAIATEDEDEFTYVLNDDVTILVYNTSKNTWFDADADIFDVDDEGDFTHKELKDVAGLDLYVIAEDDEDHEDVKNVKTIVIFPIAE